MTLPGFCGHSALRGVLDIWREGLYTTYDLIRAYYGPLSGGLLRYIPGLSAFTDAFGLARQMEHLGALYLTRGVTFGVRGTSGHLGTFGDISVIRGRWLSTPIGGGSGGRKGRSGC